MPEEGELSLQDVSTAVGWTVTETRRISKCPRSCRARRGPAACATRTDDDRAHPRKKGPSFLSSDLHLPAALPSSLPLPSVPQATRSSHQRPPTSTRSRKSQSTLEAPTPAPPVSPHLPRLCPRRFHSILPRTHQSIRRRPSNHHPFSSCSLARSSGPSLPPSPYPQKHPGPFPTSPAPCRPRLPSPPTSCVFPRSQWSTSSLFVFPHFIMSASSAGVTRCCLPRGPLSSFLR